VAGIWGTLAVGLLGDLTVLNTGNTRWEQIGAQALGVAVCGLWSVSITWLFMTLWSRWGGLRVSEEDENAPA
jgi:ammonium transporter, Amt family